jgi:hypothetical protein
MEDINFYEIGRKDVSDIYAEIGKRYKLILEQYGQDEAEQYFIGVKEELAKIDEYDLTSFNNLNENNVLNATSDIGVENTRNNSYFGYSGTSQQYSKIDYNGYPSYIEPKNK